MADGGIKQDSVYGQHEEYFEHTCTRCAKKGRNAEASYYCQTCNQFFCSSCRGGHDEFASDHVVLDTSESDLWGIPRTPRLDTEECVIHEGQQITIYCSQHEVLCCAVCASLDHSSCEKKDFVPDLARNIWNSQEMKSFVSSISTIQKRLKKVRNTKSQQKTSLNESQTNYKETMKEFRTTVDALLRNLERATDQYMNTLYQNRDSELQNHLAKCDQFIQEFDDLQTKLSDTSIDEAKRFVIMKNGKEKVLDCTEVLQALSQPVDYDIAFSLDKTILETMEGAEDLGKFSQNPEPGKSTEIKCVNNFREYEIRADVDKKTCDIQGICMLADGTIIMSDHNNKNIKRLDENYVTIEVCPMPGNPNGVCSIGKREVAVALGSKKKVQIVSVTDKMRTTEELSFKHNCNGIAYCKDTLYLTGGWAPTLYEYTLTRSSSQTTCILIRSFASTSPKSVALSGDGNFVYLVGMDDKLTIQSRHGSYAKSAEHPNMKKYGTSPSVCVDMKGNVLVSLQFAGVLQFKNSGTAPNGVLIGSHRVMQPEIVFVDSLRSKLILQRNSTFGGSDKVDVWDIEY